MEKNRNAHTNTFWHHIAIHALTNGRTFFFSSVLHFPLIASLGIRLHFLRFASIILLHPFYPSRFLPSLSQTVKYHNGTEFLPNHTQIRLFTSFPIFDFPDNVLRLSFELEAIQCWSLKRLGFYVDKLRKLDNYSSFLFWTFYRLGRRIWGVITIKWPNCSGTKEINRCERRKGPGFKLSN